MSLAQLTLPFMNGAPEGGYQCANCGTHLGSERAAANTAAGVKFFCKMERGDKPEDSCYLQWQQKHRALSVQ